MTDAMAPASGDGSFAARRVMRVMSLTLEVAALILLGLNAPSVLDQVPLFPAWWDVAALAAIAAPAAAIIATGAWIAPRVLQALCGVQALGLLGVLLAVPIALAGQRVTVGSGMPWPVELSVIAGAASAVCWGAVGTLAYGAVLQVTVFALVVIAPAAPQPGSAFGDATFGLFFVTLFTCLALALRRAGVVLDNAVASAVADARAAATADATRSARRRVASLIHDSVIVALLTYAERSVDYAIAVAEADGAIAAIRDFESARPSTDRSPTDLAWELQALTTELDPEAAFEYALAGDSAVPAAVADAVGEAVAEALRNSIGHAGPHGSVAREVRVMASEAALEIVVLDDGAGFDLEDVPETRLGIRHGILGRMAAIPGASARVFSTTGSGAVVLLQWRRT